MVVAFAWTTPSQIVLMLPLLGNTWDTAVLVETMTAGTVTAATKGIATVTVITLAVVVVMTATGITTVATVTGRIGEARPPSRAAVTPLSTGVAGATPGALRHVLLAPVQMVMVGIMTPLPPHLVLRLMLGGNQPLQPPLADSNLCQSGLVRICRFVFSFFDSAHSLSCSLYYYIASLAAFI